MREEKKENAATPLALVLDEPRPKRERPEDAVFAHWLRVMGKHTCFYQNEEIVA